MKVLFLDVDGVLNSLEWSRTANGFGYPPGKTERCTKKRLKWCPAMVNRLKRVIDATDTSIVISSSWRGYGDVATRKWRAMFNVYGWRNAPVIGETPDLARQQSVDSIYVPVRRGEEVAAWLHSHQNVDQFVCVDDTDDFLPGQPLILTDMQTGLTEEAALKCIVLLGNKKQSRVRE